jgi:hypothetical protein
MAATKEAAIKRKIRAILDEFEAYWVMPVSNGMGNHGVPDFLVCCNGRFIGIEAKAGTNKPTALQQAHIDRIFDAGGYALVINEDNLHVLQELMEWTTKK